MSKNQEELFCGLLGVCFVSLLSLLVYYFW